MDDASAPGSQTNAWAAKVLSLEVALLSLQRDLNILEGWVNEIERQIIALNQDRHLKRANILLVCALRARQQTYSGLARRVAALEVADL